MLTSVGIASTTNSFCPGYKAPPNNPVLTGSTAGSLV